jgi:catechol 2,3-dioxygenase-like lactoylglutathione lyase family enzyme
MRVLGMDHIVLRCNDVERSLAWYVRVVGLEPLRVEEWRSGQVPFPSVRIDAGTIIDLIARRTIDDHIADDHTTNVERNLDHLCLVVQADDIDAVVADPSFTIVDGPAERFGARGTGWSVYVTDPDDNVVEFRAYR